MIIFARLLILQNSNRRMDWSNRCGKYERNNWSYNYFWNRNIPLYLKKVKMKKGNSDFILGDNYIYGELLTTN
jgi:hypothetical protein